jgi:predicted lipid-binding transport protein (Tim44 family)
VGAHISDSLRERPRAGAWRRVLLTAVPLGLLLALGPAEMAHALAGGGIGGFGGGGGGGGGGGFGGGGFGGGGGGGSGERAVWGILTPRGALFLVLILLYLIRGVLRGRRARRATEQREPFSPGLLVRGLYRVLLWPLDMLVEWRRLGRRAQRVRLAAAEAAEDDPRFAPDVVVADAEQLFCAIQSAWSANDRVTLARLVAPEMMVEWERRLTGFAVHGWSNEVELKGSVHVDYVGLRNAGEERAKQVVVRVRARVRDVVLDKHGHTIHRRSSLTDTHHICEYWTLGTAREGWMLASIEQHHEGLHQLHEPLLPSPWSDTGALQREATLEQAAAARVANDQIHEIAPADLEQDARTAALDLSLVDDRFAPRVLGGEVQWAVSAWAQAIDGDDASLQAVAGPAAVAELLYPGDPQRERRLVVRGPRVRSLRILELRGRDTPPAMLVELHVSGRRYVEDRTTTTVVQGDRSLQTSFTMRWRMELTDDDTHPWRIAAVAYATRASDGAPHGPDLSEAEPAQR